MNLHQLRIFHTAAQRGSFTAAADDLFMSQPAVSLQIRSLERDLGVKLFERSSAGLDLTEAGQALFHSAQAILIAESEAQRIIAEIRGASRGTLVIGANTTGGMYVVPPLIKAFRDRHPHVDIVLQIEHTERLCERTAQGIIDFGFVGGPLQYRGITVEHLARDAVVAIVSPEYPLAERSSISVIELADYPLILAEAGSRTRALVEARLREHGINVRPAMQMSGTEAVKKAVEASLGIGFVSAHSIERELRLGCLATIRVEGLEIVRDFELIYRTEKYLTPLDKEFRAFSLNYGAQRIRLPQSRR